jgi:hypothetical protein
METIARPEGEEDEKEVRLPPSLEEDDQQRALWERAIGWGIVAVCTWLAFNVLDSNHDWLVHFGNGFPWLHFGSFRFGDLFLNTTTNGGDMGAHVWWPKFLETHWFPKGRLSGWAPDWYDGFPLGQYYFPLPALEVAFIDHLPFVPYNVAFKLTTVTGPLLLPASAYYFARGLRAPWPAPPAFSLAALGMLMETRTDWQIYGGNIASTLAGEFSFTIALALGLFALGALARTLDTGKRRWLPTVLIAATIMSHIVVGIVIGIAAVLLWLTRRPWRTWPLAILIGVVGVALTAVWLVPLVANQAYTQSMRYTKLYPKKGFTMWSWLPVPGPIRNTINGIVRSLANPVDPNTHKHVMQPLWLPWWIWVLGGVAVVAAAYYRRRSTGFLLLLAGVIAIMFVQWPEIAIWNTRFLPFWLLTCGFIAAMGATEICRWIAQAVAWAYGWIREGDLQDARARAWAELATDDDPSVDPELKKQAAWVLAERRFDSDPEGWEPPERLQAGATRRRKNFVKSVALAAVIVIVGCIALNRAWDARNGNPAIAITGWASWNYQGYEKKAAYPQYKAIMDGMSQVADQYGNGRALWEPTSGDPDAINSYGTSLALELLPYFTNGRIGSMEGIYFESSATTSYHFLTVSECAEHPSNPVRGLDYGTVSTDFDLCVRHLQDLGVKYLMLWSDEANAKAAQSPDLKLIKTIDQNPPIAAPGDSKLSAWKVYEVADTDLVKGMDQLPVVAKLHGGKYSYCWNQPNPDPTTPEPKLGPWECTVAPWWVNRDELNVQFAQSGPKEWKRVDGRELASVQPEKITPVNVSNISRDVDTIKFHVDEVGKPVVVKESYYPNWQASGAKGPYRLAPNLMVVIPTKNDVTLTYGLTKADWLGRIVTFGGLIGVVLLGLWVGGRRFAGDPAAAQGDEGDGTDGDGTADADDDGDRGDVDADDPDAPPDRREPEPALP